MTAAPAAPAPAPAPAAPAAPAAERRSLHFDSLPEALADVEALVAAGPVVGLGAWTPAQVIDHVRRVVTMSLDGATFTMPLPYRILGRLLKSTALARPARSGFRIPKAASDAFAPPADVTLEQALADFRADVERASRPGAMTEPSPLLGPMTHEDWTRLHCRHAELHFSHLVPGGDA